MSGKRWIWIGALVVAAIGIGGAAWAARGPMTYAQIATGYAAKQTCSCIWVSDRPLHSCVEDLPDDARRNITITQTAFDGRIVRASVAFGLISAEAVSHPEYGCTLRD